METPQPSTEFRTRLTDLEEATWRGLQKSGSAMIPFITKDCIMQFPMGLKLTASSEPSVSDVLHSPAFVPWKSFEMINIDVTPIGAVGEETGGVVSYLVKAVRRAGDMKGEDAPGEKGKKGEEAEFEALCVSVWRWDGEKYAMCFHQQTLTN